MNFPSQLSDIRTLVVQTGRLSTTLDAARINHFINEAYADVAQATKFWEGSVVGAALAANAQSQSLPAAIIELEDVVCAYAGVNQPLIQRTWEQLLYLRRYSVTGGGPPLFYSLRKNSVEFWPAAQGSEVLTYYGSKQPDAWLVNDSDVPDMPEPFATNLLLYGALVKTSEFKADLLMLGNHQQQYAAWLAKFQAFCNVRLGTGSLAFPIYPGEPSAYPHDPSSDWYVMAGVPWAG